MNLFILGTYQIPFELLHEPPPSLKIREVKEWYVQYLMDILTEDDHENITAPLLVVASVTKDMFHVQNIDKYFYQVCK